MHSPNYRNELTITAGVGTRMHDNSTKREESFFENGEKIKWTLYDERSDNLLFFFFLFASSQATLTLPAAFLSMNFLWYGIAHTGEIFVSWVSE